LGGGFFGVLLKYYLVFFFFVYSVVFVVCLFVCLFFSLFFLFFSSGFETGSVGFIFSFWKRIFFLDFEFGRGHVSLTGVAKCTGGIEKDTEFQFDAWFEIENLDNAITEISGLLMNWFTGMSSRYNKFTTNLVLKYGNLSQARLLIYFLSVVI
jgi:hypothetical protein